MADNVLMPPTGSGTADVTVATDDVSSIHYQKVKLVDGRDGETGAIQADGVTKALVTIDYAHHEVHGGGAFHITGALSGSIGDGVAYLLAFKTPNTAKLIHFLPSAWGKGQGRLELLSGSTWTQGTGSAIPVHNSNLDDGSSSTVLENRAQPAFTASDEVMAGVTIVAAGTVVWDDTEGTGKAGGGTRAEHEIILARDTQYTLRYTSEAASGQCRLSPTWYEHTHPA